MRFVFEVRLEDGSVRSFSKSAERIYIGRASVNDLVLTSELVSAQHALVDGTGATAVVSDMNSSNGTFLNGNRLTAPSNLRVGDVIAFGVGGSAIVAKTLEPEVRAPRTMPIRREDLVPKNRVVRVGRAADNDLVLEDPSVSGHHARVILDRPGHGIVEDLQSTNGIAVGTPANRVARGDFSAGDLIYFGSAAVSAEKLLAFQMPPVITAPPVMTLQPVGRPRVPVPLLALCLVVAACLFVAVVVGAGVLLLRDRTPTVAVATPDSPAAATFGGAAQHVAQPSAASATPAPSFFVVPVDVDKIADRAAPAVVWIGVKHKLDLFPQASAWAVQPTVLVTTAAVVSEMEKLSREPDMQVVAWSRGSIIAAQSFQTDPQYSTTDPGSDNSLRHNVGIIRLADPVPSTLEIASAEKRQALGPTTPLLAVGFYSTSERQNDIYDRVKLPLNHASVTIRSAENDRPNVVPLYGVEIGRSHESSRGSWFDGAPIESAEGTVVGILSTGTKERLVLIDPSLWNGGRSH
jgi:pSer/pThr/pTyr-binding forkhead associated (FHA) protein